MHRRFPSLTSQADLDEPARAATLPLPSLPWFEWGAFALALLLLLAG